MFIFTFQLVLFPPGTWRKQKSQKRQRERYQKDLNHVSLYFIPNFELSQGCVETGRRLVTTSNCSQPAEFHHLLASVEKEPVPAFIVFDGSNASFTGGFTAH